MDGSARSIQAKHTQNQSEQGNRNVQNGQGDLARRGKPLALVQVQPVDTTETVAEPAGEKGADQTVQVAEDGDGFGDDPGDDPARDAETQPKADGSPVALVHQAGLGTEAEVDVLQANVAIDDTGADDGGDGDAVGNLAHQGTGGVQGRGENVGADVEVDDDGCGQVERDLETLEHEQRLLEVLGRLHLGDQTEESDVSAVGKDDVGDGLEGSVQVGIDGGLDNAAGVLVDTNGDHGDHDSAEDTDERSKGDPSHALHGTRDGQHKRNDHADDTEDDRAGAVVGDGVHHHAEGKNVATHDEDTEKKLAQAEKFTAEAAQQNLTGVRQVLDVRVALAHEANIISGVCSEKTKTDNQNNTAIGLSVSRFFGEKMIGHVRDQSQGRHGCGKRQNTQ